MENARSPYSISKRPPKNHAKSSCDTGPQMRRRTSHVRRKSYFYVRFRDLQTGGYLSAVSSGCTTRDAAVIWAKEEYERRFNGRPQPENPRLVDFLLSVWNPDSYFVKEKAQEGRDLSAEYVLNNGKAIKKHLQPYAELAQTRLTNLTPALIKKWRMHLADCGISARVINTTWQAIRAPVRWWEDGNRVEFPLRKA